jgi:ABC-2 type transport system ATP-binding protein
MDNAGADDPAVEVQGLSKHYGDGADAVRAVDGVDLTAEGGTAVGLLGPNGAGKTTTIKSLLGLVEPTAGAVRIAGVDVHECPAAAYRRVGAMLEGARNVYWRLTVRENLRFFAALAGAAPDAVADRHEELLERFDLADAADTPVRELSRGQKQKVSLACTLARDAEVVFLDEPTLGLDVESSLELREELRRLVAEESLTVILSSHDIDVIEAVCDRVVIMSDGRVVADDAVEDLLALFRTQRYEVVVGAPLGDDERAALAERFDADGFERRGDRERMLVSVTGEEFYDLVDRLRGGGHAVERVDTVEADLEEVFLRVTDDDAEPASTPGRSGADPETVRADGGGDR